MAQDPKVTIVNCVKNTLSKKLSNNEGIPLGPLLIASALDKEGIKVELRDYQFFSTSKHISISEFLRFLQNSSDILAIGCYSDLLPLVISGLNIYKKMYPYKKIILGGHGPSEVASSLVKTFSFIDCVVIGEGEVTTVEVVKRYLKGESLKGTRGIITRENEDIFIGGARKRIRDLDEIKPAYYLIDSKKYAFANVSTARGCPFNCLFCDASPFWDHKTTIRNLLSVFSEIEFLYRQLGFRDFRIIDDTFTLDSGRVLSFCDVFGKNFPLAVWSCYGRINLVNERMVSQMAAFGCEEIFFGIESGSNKLLKAINKGFTREMAESTIKTATKYLTARLGFIWGFPFETLDDFKETIDFIVRLKSFSEKVKVHLYMLVPRTLSVLYRRYKEDLYFNPDLPSELSCFSTEETDRKTKEELVQLIKANPKIFSSFYAFKTPALEQKIEILKQNGFWN